MTDRSAGHIASLSDFPQIPIYGKLREDCTLARTIYFIMNGYKVNTKKINSVMDLIKSLRALQGWSQEKMASTLGVRRATISDWERGKSLSRELVIGAKIGYAAAQAGLTLEEFVALVPDSDHQAEGLNVAEQAEPYKVG
jgi:DNA-binding XRE family transcriptional regulator